MNVYHDLSALPNFTSAVLTIGSYDGVHCGHQTILSQLKSLAEKVGGESVVVTFHPHPRQVLQPDDTSLRLLNTIDEKIARLKAYGVDNVVVVPFSKEFASQTADEYISNFLVRLFTPKYIVIGYDHRFGKGRVGSIDYLKKYESEFGYEVVEIKKQVVDKLAVSSTKVRQALEAGQVGRAKQLLGHPYTLSGIVIEGQRIGRSIGFPTANLDVKNKYKLIPAEGIYAVIVNHKQESYKAMLYIGNRPTLELFNNRTIEVNILDFDKEIYGDKLSLTFVKRIRGDKQFKSLEALKASIERDREKTVALFDTLPEHWMTKEIPDVDTSSLARVGVVILNYNGRKWLEKFLPSVVQTQYPNATIYVADNGSTDDSLAFLSENYPNVKTVVMNENHGFAGGYNVALKEIEEEDYFVLLNSDVAVEPDWIDPIIDAMEKDKTIAACQPKILSEQQRDHFEHAGAAGGWMDHLGYPFCRGRVFNVTEKDKGQYNDAAEIFWASGAALFIRAKLFKDIGGFDQSFFAHMEEIDLCWRIKRAGYKIMAIPESVVYHVGGGTLDYENPRKVFLNFRNSLVMLLKNESASKLFWLLPLRLVLDGLAGLLFLVEGKWKNIGAIVRAHWAFFGLIGATRKRAKEYDELIEKVGISGVENGAGRWKGSAIWGFYARGRKGFGELTGLRGYDLSELEPKSASHVDVKKNMGLTSKITGKLTSLSDDHFFTSEPIPIPYFDNKKLKIFYVEAKHEPYLNKADEVLEHFLTKSNQKRLGDSQIVFNYYEQVLKNGYCEDLKIRRITNIWDYVNPIEILINWTDQDNFFFCISCDCAWEEEHGLQLVFKNGESLTRASGHDGHYED